MSNRWIGYLTGGALLVLAIVLVLPFRDQINSTPVALTFLLVVLFTAAVYGTKPAIGISLAAMLSFNFFFLHPYNTFRISGAENWIAFSAFVITSFIAGGLSARVKRRAEESEKRQKEIEKLYSELQKMFKKASQADALKQSEQLKSALLDAVTHDLRTPLTSMKAAVTTLLAGNEFKAAFDLDEEGRREMLEVINTEIDRLNHLLEGLIGMAKLEAGAMQPQRTWSNIEEIVSISLARAAAMTARYKIHVSHEQNLPPVRVDERAIAEVLYLLLENAAKYSPPDSKILLNISKTKDALKINLEDEGMGIPAEFREKVFDKFFRIPVASAGSRVPTTGLGMGLAIARGIVEAHGGRIWIEDVQSKKGTCVSFTIPLSPSEIKIN